MIDQRLRIPRRPCLLRVLPVPRDRAGRRLPDGKGLARLFALRNVPRGPPPQTLGLAWTPPLHQQWILASPNAGECRLGKTPLLARSSNCQNVQNATNKACNCGEPQLQDLRAWRPGGRAKTTYSTRVRDLDAGMSGCQLLVYCTCTVEEQHVLA